MWPMMKKFVQANLVLLNTFAEIMGGAFVIAEVQRIAEATPEVSTYDLDSIFYGLGLSALAALPAAISLWDSFQEVKQYRLPLTYSETSALMAVNMRQTEDISIAAEIKNFIVRGVPFGLLDFGGCFIFLNKLSPFYYYNLMGSAVAGLASSGCNYYLVSQHQHNQLSWWQVMRQKTYQALLLNLLIAAFTLAGHLFQTFLDLEVFDDSVDAETDAHEKDFWLEEGLSLSIAALVTVLEGYAKLCANLHRNQKEPLALSRALMLVSSLVSYVLPGVGAIRMTEFIYELVTETSFLPGLHIGFRLSLLLAGTTLFGLPNARSYYYMHIDNVDQALRKVNTLFFKKETTPAISIPKVPTICDNSKLKSINSL